MLIGKALDDETSELTGRADGRYFAVDCGAGVEPRRWPAWTRSSPKTKAKFDRVAFRSVAWELMVGYAGKFPDLGVSMDGGAVEPSPRLRWGAPIRTRTTRTGACA